MNTKADMAAFGASETACYRWPMDTVEHRAMRAAYCDGAAWAADEIERLRAALKPFAGAVYNDNGDITVSRIPGITRRVRYTYRVVVTREAYLKAYFAFRSNEQIGDE